MWIWCVETLGSQWTIDCILISHEWPEAMIEWTDWKNGSGTALRSAEWYDFDPASGLVREIRTDYAAPADKTATIDERVGFDHRGRGYPISSQGQ